MIALLAAIVLIPLHTSGCDMVMKLKQLPDTTVVSYGPVLRDQYGCELERGEHRYSPRTDYELQRLKRENAINRKWELKLIKDMK